MSVSGLLLGPVSGFIALLQPWSVMFMATDIIEGQEGRAVQSWSCPSLTAALGRTDTPHQLSTWENESYTSFGQHNKADPVCRAVGELALRA